MAIELIRPYDENKILQDFGGSGYLLRAFVNFSGTTNTDISGLSYSQSGTTITVVYPNHGHLVNHRVRLTFQTGTASPEDFFISSVVDENTFTVTSVTSRTTNGLCTLLRRTIRKSGNVHSVTQNGDPGAYSINFLIPFSNSDYVELFGQTRQVGGASIGAIGGESRNNVSYRLRTYDTAWSPSTTFEVITVGFA